MMIPHRLIRCSITNHQQCAGFDSFVLLICLQSDDFEGEAVSDDDFQNESVSTHRSAAAAERQRVQKGKTKVCVATGGSAGTL